MEIEKGKVYGIWVDDTRPNPDASTMQLTARCFSELWDHLREVERVDARVDYVDLDFVLTDFPDPRWTRPYEKSGLDCARLVATCVDLLTDDFGYGAHSSDSTLNALVRAEMDRVVEAVRDRVHDRRELDVG